MSASADQTNPPTPPAMVDESLVFDDSLEDAITRYANDDTIRGAAKATLDMPTFPTNLRRSMEYIHKMCHVRVNGAEGKTYNRSPNYPEIYLGMFDCGFRDLVGRAEIKEIRARRKQLLLGGSEGRSMLATGWSNVPWYATSRRLYIRLLESQVARLRDLADDCQVFTSTMGVVIFANAMYSASYWFEHSDLTANYVENATKYVERFVGFIREWLDNLDK